MFHDSTVGMTERPSEDVRCVRVPDVWAKVKYWLNITDITGKHWIPIDQQEFSY